MLNYIWSFMIIVSFVCASFSGKLPEMSSAMLAGAEDAVKLAISIAGIMALWSGFLKRKCAKKSSTFLLQKK